MASASPVYVQPSDVEQRLSELALEESILITAAQRGLAAWAQCTPNHPPTFPALNAWAETICALREGLPRWNKPNESNQPLVVNEAGTIAITVAAGDENTGVPDAIPATRSGKGPRMAKAVQQNLQTAFDFGDPAPVIESIQNPKRSTWLLLVYRDLAARVLRCELSRPSRMDEDGHVDNWTVRIILKPTAFGEDIPAIDTGDGDAGSGKQSPEIVVEIHKRA